MKKLSLTLFTFACFCSLLLPVAAHTIPFEGTFHGPVLVPENDTYPKPLNLTEVLKELTYPKSLKDKGIEGKVLVKITVSKTGKYVKHEVLHSEHTLMTEAVDEIIENITFSPAEKEGKAIKSEVTLPFMFKL